MSKLLVATASAIGMGMLFTAADVSAMPVNATVVNDAVSANPAVTPVRYYYYVYRWHYYRPYYRYHWHRWHWRHY
jgi:hypothetical protein